MVQWKDEITVEEAGEKAARLDSVDNFPVPNFFAITKTEVESFVGEKTAPEDVLNSKIPGELESRIEDAFSDISMSSEVRNASGRARSLVGGSRDSQRVSVRVSNSDRGEYRCELNVGSSGLMEAVRKVVASYYQENSSGTPAVIVQKMVEPGFTGAAVQNYLGNYTLIETVEGLGTSLEEGFSEPVFFLMKDGELVEERIPENQRTLERNKMNGSHETDTESFDSRPIPKEDLEELADELDKTEYSLKFVYSRGEFHAVDAFSQNMDNGFRETEAGLEGVRVSRGVIEGEVGREVVYSKNAELHENTEALIARKGGYTSSAAQKARRNNIPAVLSFRPELEVGEHIRIEENTVEPGSDRKEMVETSSSGFEKVAASEVLPINAGDGVYVSPPFRGRYAVAERETDGRSIPPEGLLTSYAQVFSFEGDRLVLDARRLPEKGLENALEYLDAKKKILFTDPDFDLVLKALGEGFDVFATEPRKVEQLEKVVERAERRFMLDRLRDV